jgi:hypothetical protein
MSLVSPPSSNGWTTPLMSLKILLRIRGFVIQRYGSVPKCHGSGTLVYYLLFYRCNSNGNFFVHCTAGVRAARYKLHNGTATWGVLSFVDWFSSAVRRLPIGQTAARLPIGQTAARLPIGQTAARLPIGRATACPRLVIVDAETLPLGFEHCPWKKYKKLPTILTGKTNHR